ncbi:MAG: tape measure protein, partial [Chromatiaceae bacterium]
MTQPVDQVSVAILPDFKRFATEMRRGVDEAMREFTRRVETSLQQVEQAVADGGRELGEDFQRGGEQAERAFEELDRSARRHLDSIDRQTTQAATGLRTKLGGAAAIAGAAILGIGAAAAAGLGVLTFMGLKSAASMEQTQIAFDALMGSAEAGKKVFDDLQKFATFTPFEFADLTKVAQRFFTFADATGIAKDRVVEFLTPLGNVASLGSGGAEAMNRVALAMQQINASGRLMGDELLQISDAMPQFNARLAIANYLGITQAELARRQAAGLIDAKTAIMGLLDGMRQFPGAAGAMEKQSQTLMGVFSTFKDTMDQTLVKAFQPVIPAIKESLLEVTPIFQEALQDMAPVLGTLLSALLPLLGGLAKAAVPILEPLVDGLAKFVESIPPEALQQIGEAIGEALIPLIPLIPLILDFFLVLLQLAVPVLRLLGAGLGLVQPVLQLFADALHELSRALAMVDWSRMGEAIGGFFRNISDAIGSFFSDLFGKFGEINTKTVETFTKVKDTIAAHINEAIDTIKAIPGRALDALSNAKDLLIEKGKDLIRGLWDGIKGMGGWLYQKVKTFAYDNTVGALKNALGIGSPSQVAADEVGRWIPPGIGMGALEAMPALRSMLADATRGVVIGAVPAMAGAGAGGSVSFGPGSVVVQFTGAAPTPQQALDTG